MVAEETSTRDTSGRSRPTLPPGQKSTTHDHEQAPVDTDGSFLDTSHNVFDRRPPAPLDEETGAALLLAPHDLTGLDESDINFHHPYGRVWSKSAAQMPESERVLRRSGGQRTPKIYHNGDHSEKAFHKLVADASLILPTEVSEHIGLMELAQIGFLPDEVAATQDGELLVRSMTDRERHILLRPRAFNLDDQQVAKFHIKWCPEKSLETARRTLTDYRERQVRYSYRDIDSGSDYNHVRLFLTKELLSRALTDDSRGRVRRLVEAQDADSDELLLTIVVNALSATATLRGKLLRDVYPTLLKRGQLYPDMPDTIEPFLLFRLANPLGGIALSPETRKQLLGREAETLVA